MKENKTLNSIIYVAAVAGSITLPGCASMALPFAFYAAGTGLSYIGNKDKDHDKTTYASIGDRHYIISNMVRGDTQHVVVTDEAGSIDFIDMQVNGRHERWVERPKEGSIINSPYDHSFLSWVDENSARPGKEYAEKQASFRTFLDISLGGIKPIPKSEELDDLVRLHNKNLKLFGLN